MDRMTGDLSFQSTLILLDAGFLLEDVSMVRKTLRERMPPSALQGDLTDLLSLAALDASEALGKPLEGNIQAVLFIGQDQMKAPMPLEPAFWEALDGKATRTAWGEMSFLLLTVHSGMSMADLQTDILRLALADRNVERLVLFPLSRREGGSQVLRERYVKACVDLRLEAEQRRACLLSLFPPAQASPEGLIHLPLAPSLAYVLGQRSEG